jgi:hypothetical protein
MFIGICGLAGSGKDLFVENLVNEISKAGLKAKRYSFGDNLKKEIAPIIFKEKGLNPLNCSREEKEAIRPILVDYAKQKRALSKGRYWIEKLEDTIGGDVEKPDIYCISDVRYAEYDKDEFYWLKKEKNGILVHISKFYKKDGQIISHLPPNEEEAKNDPILNQNADYKVIWEHGDKYARRYIVQFLEWARKTRKLEKL